MTAAIEHPNEPDSNAAREAIAASEPRALRTYTPSQAVIARSAGISAQPSTSNVPRIAAHHPITRLGECLRLIAAVFRAEEDGSASEDVCMLFLFVFIFSVSNQSFFNLYFLFFASSSS